MIVADELGADWSRVQIAPPPLATVTTKDIQEAQRLQLGSPLAVPAIDTGDVTAAMKGAKRVVQASYFVPFLHHATMEPTTCTAHLTADRFEFWVPTQNLTGVDDVRAKVSGLPLDKVVVNATLLGGGFGRKFEQDFVMQAALIAKAVRARCSLSGRGRRTCSTASTARPCRPA